jgi:superfamily II DNA or RNA helicase
LELCDQSVAKILLWGDVPIGVMRADDERTNPDAPIQVATIQTLARRRLPPADIVLSDEFHHDASEGRRNILNSYPEATILGWSATPIRLDGQPLKELYDSLVIAASYSELIAGGFIVDPICYSTPAAVDLSQVKTVAGDYAIDGLDVVMNEPHVLGDIVKEWQDHAEGRATVVFACTIKHSLAIVARFVAAGIRAEHLDGTVEEVSRRACLRRLRDGHVQVVVQCNVLTEGFDEAAVKCLVLARPTQSLSLYMQAAGRVMRPYRDVKPVLLDFSGNIDRHGLPHEDRVWSLFDAPRLKAKSPYRTCPKCYAYVLRNPCELCGHFATPEEREVREKLAASRLVERGAEDTRRVYFVAQLTKAKLKGFKPGFASAKYKEKFGEYPPWSWGQEAKQAMDPGWAARIDRHSQEREFWKKQNEGSMTIDVPDEKEERPDDDVTDEIDQGGIPF